MKRPKLSQTCRQLTPLAVSLFGPMKTWGRQFSLDKNPATVYCLCTVDSEQPTYIAHRSRFHGPGLSANCRWPTSTAGERAPGSGTGAAVGPQNGIGFGSAFQYCGRSLSHSGRRRLAGTAAWTRRHGSEARLPCRSRGTAAGVSHALAIACGRGKSARSVGREVEYRASQRGRRVEVMNITTAMIVFPVLLVGILFQFTPLLTRRGIYFSATVAAGFPQSGDGRRLLRSYRMQAALWTLAAVGLSMLLFRACPIYGVLAPMLLLLVGTGFSYWLKFRDIHEHYGETRPEIRQAELVTPVAQQSFHPQLWILPFAALAVTAFYLHAHWSQLPESFPVHWGPDGHPNRWSTRDGSGVYGPLLIGTGVNLLLLALAWLFTRYSRNTVMRRVTIRLTELLLYPITFSFVMLALLPLVQLPIWLVPAVIAISIAADHLLVVPADHVAGRGQRRRSGAAKRFVLESRRVLFQSRRSGDFCGQARRHRLHHELRQSLGLAYSARGDRRRYLAGNASRLIRQQP